MPKSYYLSDNMVNAALRNTPFVPPVTVYVALFTVTPNPAGGGTEVSGGSYARQATTFSVPSNGTSSNSALIAFPVATAAWGTLTSFAVFDALAGGNLLYFANLNAPRTVLINDQVQFPVGQLQVIED